MGNTFFFGWEVTLMAFLQTHMGTAGLWLARLFTYAGEELVIIPVMGYLYWCRNKEMGKFVGVNMTVALVWNPLIKNLFLRRRPYMDHAVLACLKPVNAGDIYDVALQGYSFPSGHSTNAAAVYGSIAAYVRKRTVTAGALLLILFIGVSRFCLGVHYPTDVLCGWALGGAVVGIMTVLQQKVQKKWKLYAGILLVSLPGCLYCSSTDYFSTLGIMAGMFAGILFEERFVHFPEATATLQRILRLSCGILIYLAVHQLLKLPFPSELLQSTEAAGMALRTLRHGVEVFVIVGLYPILFKKSIFSLFHR